MRQCILKPPGKLVGTSAVSRILSTTIWAAEGSQPWIWGQGRILLLCRTGHPGGMLGIPDLQELNVSRPPPAPPRTPDIVIMKNTPLHIFPNAPWEEVPPLPLPPGPELPARVCRSNLI